MSVNSPKIFAVTGNPVAHSKSPFIFNSLFAAKQINAKYILLPALSATEVMQFARNEKIVGLNVTSPFKQDIVPLLAKLSIEAEFLGAVNTVVFQTGEYIGFNTDYYGVISSLQEHIPDLNNKRIVIMGAGGAAISAVYGLSKFNNHISIVNRNLPKAEAVAEKFKIAAFSLDNLQKLLNNADIFISCISDSDFPFASFSFNKSTVILDAIYNNSSLEKVALHNKNCFIGGINWLMHHATQAFKLFTGEEITIDEVRNILKYK